MPLIKLKDNYINYNITGKGEPIILLHNGFYSTETWSNIRDRLSNYFKVIDYDRQGYGKSDRFNELKGDIIKHGVEELEALVDLLNLESFYLCGHCLGGAIALLYSFKHPQKVKKIIVESVGYFSDEDLLNKSDWTFQAFNEISDKLQNLLIKMHGIDYAEIFWETLRNYKESYIMNKDYTILNELKKIKHPVFIINGDRDFYFNVEHPIKAYNILKNALLWIVPQTGHDPHIEREDDFIANVIRFINEKPLESGI